jgi:hypothetical protein
VTGPPAQSESALLEAHFDLLALALGALLAGLWLLQLHGRGERAADFEAQALGRRTVSHFAALGDTPIHCRDLRDAELCLAGHAHRGARPVVLWLGNSQLHAVNEYEPGDETSASLLWPSLAADELDLLTFSQPNANLQEHLVLYAWLADRLPLRALVLPLVFDDCRESGVRGSLTAALDDPGVRARLQRLEIGAKILEDNRRSGRRGSLAALHGTLQQPVEAAMVQWLDVRIPLWEERSRTRAAIVLGLYELRNAALGIDASAVRHALPGRQALNLAAAEALLRDARERRIATLVYLAPLRGDVRPRHVPSEYAAFVREAAALAARTGARFADLQAAIPVEAWGSGPDEDGAAADVQHFAEQGHAQLARSVGRELRAALAEAP